MGFHSAETMWASPFAGALWENHVIGQWLRWRDWHQPAAMLWYWRDQAGNEVDLLVELDGRLHCIECKLTERPGRTDLRGLQKIASFYGEEIVASRTIACSTQAPYEVAPGITARPGCTVWPLA